MHLGISAACISPHHKYSVNVLLRIGLDQAYTSSVVFVHLAERNTIIVERREVCAHIVISDKICSNDLFADERDRRLHYLFEAD